MDLQLLESWLVCLWFSFPTAVLVLSWRGISTCFGKLVVWLLLAMSFQVEQGTF